MGRTVQEVAESKFCCIHLALWSCGRQSDDNGKDKAVRLDLSTSLRIKEHAGLHDVNHYVWCLKSGNYFWI